MCILFSEQKTLEEFNEMVKHSLLFKQLKNDIKWKILEKHYKIAEYKGELIWIIKYVKGNPEIVKTTKTEKYITNQPDSICIIKTYVV